MKNKAKRRKPRPGDDAFAKQCLWSVEFLEKLRQTPSIHGIRWTHNMVNHYYDRFDKFFKRAPTGQRKKFAKFKIRAKSVKAWSDDLV